MPLIPEGWAWAAGDGPVASQNNSRKICYFKWPQNDIFLFKKTSMAAHKIFPFIIFFSDSIEYFKYHGF